MPGIAQWGEGPPLSEATHARIRRAFGGEPPAEFLSAFRQALSTYRLCSDNPPPSRRELLDNLAATRSHAEALRELLEDSFVEAALGVCSAYPVSQRELRGFLKALEQAADVARRDLPGGRGGSPPKNSRSQLGALVAEALDPHLLYRPDEDLKGPFRECFEAACEELGEPFPEDDKAARRVLRQALRAAALIEDWGPLARNKDPEEDPRLGDYCPLRPPRDTPPQDP